MTTATSSATAEFGGPLELSEGRVTAIDGDRVRVRLVGAGAVEVRARNAVPGYVPAEGDRVLVTNTPAAAYVTGVLRGAAPRSVATSGGASATVDGELISLRDREGRVVVAFDGSTGELRLAAEADLRLAAPRGRLVLEGGADVEIAAGERVSLRGKAIALDAAVTAVTAGVYDLRAGRIVERATDAFRTVEGLFETRAKHARTIVERTLELLGRRTTIASEEDTRVEGKRVLLG